ncbi:ankyrin repeat domain-containing protein [Streptosporangium sp. NPDC023615]|uniref:ankyrin repeat domain-containing protein n=1 Tax=Streptosporangium sp. NPDC023615 TaxID=3154794 RepID=UPI0034361E69
MPDRHLELPARPNPEYYRKQAKHLRRAYATGDAAAEARVADVLGDRAAERFLLGDAQFVIAQEHGFRTWAEFRAHIDSRGTTEDRPVSRLSGIMPGAYASMADALLAELRRNDPGALRRLRAYVPRHATATAASAASAAELRDARLIIARELGFPTWRELVSFTERSRHDLDERQESRRRLHREAEALLAGDTDRLAGLTAEQAGTLLDMLAGPETIPGVLLGKKLGVPRAAVEVLLGRATDLDVPLLWAARSDRVEYVRLLLEAGADPGTRISGGTPLENAVLLGNTEVVDLLAGHGIVPRALWTYAACGRLDRVRACFDADGGLRPDAATARPDLADAGVGFPPRLPPTDDPREIVGEALVHACQHGRTEVVRWFLDHGVHPDVAPYLGRTGLHWAIPDGHLDVVRLLLERGADPSIRDTFFRLDADGWLHMSHAAHPHDPVTRRLHDLIESRSHRATTAEGA